MQTLVAEAKTNGQEIVVVMGVGFVGAVMAAIVADTVNEDGSPAKFVIGMQRPSVRSFWKIPTLNKGICPVKAEDPQDHGGQVLYLDILDYPQHLKY
jgi:UDP-N-acetyl-D-glucosamine dehydrogenase